jgi:GNAT superfamily N-acetyltransferase
MDVREMTDLEREGVVNLHRRAARELGTTAYSDLEARAWAGGRSRCDYDIHDSDAELFVAVTQADVTDVPAVERSPGGGEGDVAGYGELRVDENEVRAVYVSPTYAGDGVGSLLLEQLEVRARAHDLDELQLTASLNAVGFYEHHAYEVTDCSTIETSGDTITARLDVRVMQKPL